MKKLLLLTLTTAGLLVACGDDNQATISEQEKKIAELEKQAQKLTDALKEEEVPVESEVLEETTEAIEEDGYQMFETNVGEVAELKETLPDYSYTQGEYYRVYEEGSPIEHEIFKLQVSSVVKSKYAASDLTVYELIPEDGFTHIIVTLIAENVSNRATGSGDSIKPKLAATDGEKIIKDFKEDPGIANQYLEILGFDGNPELYKKIPRMTKFEYVVAYKVPDEYLDGNTQWQLMQSEMWGYSGEPYLANLGTLKTME